MGIVLLVSVLIPLAVVVVALIASKIFLWQAFRKVNRLNQGWEKLYKKMLHDGWIPPKESRWFRQYIDSTHPGRNPIRCHILVAEEE
jgi:hypothetical protein